MVKITVDVDGMMCNMCEAHVNDAIRKKFPIKKVKSSHKDGKTIIISEEEISGEDIEKAIGETGYKVLGMETESIRKKGLFGFKK